MKNETLEVVVASLNPVKQWAARHAFEQAFPEQEIKVSGLSVASGVRDQPLTDEETLRGAQQRVAGARRLLPDADFWVGLEGGVAEVPSLGLQAFGWMCVQSPTQQHSARSGSFPLPIAAVARIAGGEELGPIMDELFQAHNSRQKGGAVGLLTNGLVSREALYVQPLIFALIPFLQPDLF